MQPQPQQQIPGEDVRYENTMQILVSHESGAELAEPEEGQIEHIELTLEDNMSQKSNK